MNLINLTTNYGDITFSINIYFVLIIIFIAILFKTPIIPKLYDGILNRLDMRKTFEISEFELGLGTGTIHFTPNYKDREIAYKLWVELSTRKLGLELNWDEDVIVEVYDSWYAFFGVSRELLKEFPISKLNNNEDYKLINIITKLLNDVLRKHLTTWQAKFRKWYDEELDKEDNIGLTPQEIQEKYIHFKEIKEDMEGINGNLIYFMNELYLIATNGDNND